MPSPKVAALRWSVCSAAALVVAKIACDGSIKGFSAAKSYTPLPISL